jgi:hypothetical protein
MKPQVCYTTDAGIVRIAYCGDFVNGVSSEAIRRAGEIAAEKKIRRLLFDLREANFEGYYVPAIKHADEGPSLGVKKTFRIALTCARSGLR